MPDQTPNDFMDPIGEDESKNQISKPNIVSEYRQFLNSKIFNVYDNPLLFWRDSKYDNFKKVAASIFCIPVSSAEPERHNSAAGNTITPMRNRMNENTVEELVLINEFLKNC